MRVIIISILIQIMVINTLEAQSETCLALLEDGKYNYLKETTYYEDIGEAQSAICRAYESIKSDRSLANAKAQYKMVFKGSGNYSRDEIERVFKMYCEENYSMSEITNNRSIERRFIDPALLKSYEACIEAFKDNIIFEIRPNEDFSQVTFIADYEGESGNIPTIRNISFDQEKVRVVEGEMLKAAENNQKLLGSHVLILERKDITETPFKRGEDSLYATSHNVSFNFGTEVYTVLFPEVKHKTKNEPKIQSGSVSIDGNDPMWTLTKNQTEKAAQIIPVRFDGSFEAVPRVITSLYSISASKDYNSNISVTYDNVTVTGFDIHINVWGGTEIYGIGVSWIAHTD